MNAIQTKFRGLMGVGALLTLMPGALVADGDEPLERGSKAEQVYQLLQDIGEEDSASSRGMVDRVRLELVKALAGDSEEPNLISTFKLTRNGRNLYAILETRGEVVLSLFTRNADGQYDLAVEFALTDDGAEVASFYAEEAERLLQRSNDAKNAGNIDPNVATGGLSAQAAGDSSVDCETVDSNTFCCGFTDETPTTATGSGDQALAKNCIICVCRKGGKWTECVNTCGSQL